MVFCFLLGGPRVCVCVCVSMWVCVCVCVYKMFNRFFALILLCTNVILSKVYSRVVLADISLLHWGFGFLSLEFILPPIFLQFVKTISADRYTLHKVSLGFFKLTPVVQKLYYGCHIRSCVLPQRASMKVWPINDVDRKVTIYFFNQSLRACLCNALFDNCNIASGKLCPDVEEKERPFQVENLFVIMLLLGKCPKLIYARGKLIIVRRNACAIVGTQMYTETLKGKRQRFWLKINIRLNEIWRKKFL